MDGRGCRGLSNADKGRTSDLWKGMRRETEMFDRQSE